MARSMTGFGSGEAPYGGGRLSVEVRSVNHRHLDLRLNLPSELSGVAFAIEQRLRNKLHRGRFDVAVRLAGAAPPGSIDRERARAAYRALAELRDELAPAAELPISVLAAVPDLFGKPAPLDEGALLAAFDAAVSLALAQLDGMRAAEGAALSLDLRAHLRNARASREIIARQAPAIVDAHRLRLRERVGRLVGPDVAVDPGRLEMEIAVLADRCDVSEELARLGSHLDQLDALLSADGALGKKIDFLLQEMAREASTLGAKSQSVAVTREVVELRTAIERMREQAQNLE